MSFAKCRVLVAPQLRGLKRDCPDCGQPMQSTGRMYFQPDWSERLWRVGFWCPKDQNTVLSYFHEWLPLLDALSAGVDVSKLPKWDRSVDPGPPNNGT